MTSKHFAVVAMAAVLGVLPGSAQNASDLLQKGLHLQEAAGDVDGAIVFFRQVVNSASATNKPLAAQAQYQLVLCMLQKGDRAAAEKELAALENNFPSMPDLIEKAKKLIPGSAALLAAPWGDGEYAQLNIKRDGAATGEYLYYSVDPWTATVNDQEAKYDWNSQFLPALVLHWELKTRSSRHSINLTVDRDTLRPVEWTRGRDHYVSRPNYATDDALGDPLVTPFNGPATDAEVTVFLMRRLPLAVGFKTTLPVSSNTPGPVQMELAVTGMESVQTPAGKFNCYKVQFASIGQTFWIGAEGARPLVKFQSGGVEAELVKTWGPENPLAAMQAMVEKAGATLGFGVRQPGGVVTGSIRFHDTNWWMTFKMRKIHTSAGEIAEGLQRRLKERIDERHLNPTYDLKLRPESLQTKAVGGQQVLSALLDYRTGPLTAKEDTPVQDETLYVYWIQSGEFLVEFQDDRQRDEIPTQRWRMEPVLGAIRIP